MSSITDSPPRAPRVKYAAPLGTRWEKEKAAAGKGAFDFPDDPKYVGPWIIGECVGKGASGRVKIAKHRLTGQLAAVKILPLQPLVSARNAPPGTQTQANLQAKCEKQRLGIDREITMMKLMNHPNIMRIFDVYEGDKELYLILEYVEGGELFDFLVNRGKLPPMHALAYFKQIIYGLNYAHTFSIIHRDLKPENILIHSLDPPLIKIADWGMAAFAPPDRQLDTSCGSPHYASPEIVNGLRYTGTATDIWSCGVILFALLTGRLPFDDKNVRALLGKVKLGKYEIPPYVDPLARDLLAKMLVVDVNKRITMPQILVHAWFQTDTPSIMYVPAPSVTELAQPLLSAQHIDGDLLESLCVIWGRGSDIDKLKLDLLSPPGHGTLAKAIYFLLAHHREQTLKERGILMDIDSTADGKIITKPYVVPSPRPRQSEMFGRDSTNQQHQTQQVQRHRPTIPKRMATAPAGTISVSKAASSFIVPAVPNSPPNNPSALGRSRSRPASPAGPRPRPLSSEMNASHISSSPVPGPSRTSPNPGSSAISMPPPALGRTQSVRTSSNSGRGSAYNARTGPASPPIYAPSPQVGSMSVQQYPRTAPASTQYFNFPSMSGPRAPSTSSHLTSRTRESTIHAPAPQYPGVLRPLASAPRASNVQAQRAIDDIANRMNVLVARDNAANAQTHQQQHRQYANQQRQASNVSPEKDFVLVHPYAQTQSQGGDKENMGRHASEVGLGFGKAAEPSGKVGFADQQLGQKREKRGRPPPLEFHAMPPPRRSTFSSGSAIRSPLPNSPQSSSGISSPVVGEFKGWFSNLFNWKQTYILYSTEGVGQTQDELIRVLENMGVSVVIEDGSVFRCYADDSVDAKSVRFRIEFSAIQQNSYGTHSGPTTPRIPQTPITLQTPKMSSHASAILAKNSGRNVSAMGAYACAVVLVQEKGAVSGFRNIYRRVREHWRLDGNGGSGFSSHSPMLGHGGMARGYSYRV